MPYMQALQGNNRMKWTELASVAALSLTLQACGKSEAPASAPAAAATPAAKPASTASTASTASATDICALVSGADVAEAKGVKVGEVTARKPSDAETDACEYRHADTAQYRSVIVAQLSVFKAEKVASETIVWTKFMKTDPVSGVGDSARYREVGSALFVVTGSKAIYVQVLDNAGGGAARQAVAVKLENLLLSKL